MCARFGAIDMFNNVVCVDEMHQLTNSLISRLPKKMRKLRFQFDEHSSNDVESNSAMTDFTIFNNTSDTSRINKLMFTFINVH